MLRPDLEAKVVKVDFSQKQTSNGGNLVTFSQTIKNSDIICNFDDTTGEEIECCPCCGNPIDDCTCNTQYAKGIRREGNHSQSNIVRPKVTPPEEPKVDINKVQPVDNTAVPESTEVITNLNEEIAGEDVENINPVENFADSKLFTSLGVTENTDTNVNLDDIHEDIPQEDQMTLQEIKDAPNTMSATVQYSIENNFSLQSLKQEWKLPKFQVLRKRINEVIQVCRSSKQKWIDENNDNLKAYFDSFMLTCVNDTISNGQDFNPMLMLRLKMYDVDSKKMMRLTRVMKRMRKQMEQTGYITKPIQQEMNTAYQDIENDLYTYIDKKLKSSGKSFFPKEDKKDGKENN